MRTAGARLGEALRRAPYAWLVATLALFVMMLSPLSVLATDAEEASTGLAIGATALIAYGAVAALVLAPRVIFPKVQGKLSQNEVAVLRWALAVTPFLLGYGAVAAGAQRWSLSAGLVVSVVLLVVATRASRRSGSG